MHVEIEVRYGGRRAAPEPYSYTPRATARGCLKPGSRRLSVSAGQRSGLRGLAGGHGIVAASGPGPSSGSGAPRWGTAGNAGNIVLNLGVGGSGYPTGLSGNVLIVGDDNGVYRNTPHQLGITGASNPNKQLLIGYLADSGGDRDARADYRRRAHGPLTLPSMGYREGLRTGHCGAGELVPPGADLEDGLAGHPGRPGSWRAPRAGYRRRRAPRSARSLGMRTLARTFGGSSTRNVNRPPARSQPVLIGPRTDR